MNVIGISEPHCDAGCALLVDGELKLAVSEERFSRIKRHRGFPRRALGWILEESGLRTSEIDAFAVAKATPRRDIGPYVSALVSHYSRSEPSVGSLARAIDKGFWFGLAVPYCYVATQLLNAEISRWRSRQEIPPEKIKRVPHHPAHAYSAYHCSGYQSALVVTMDGQGGGVTSTVSEAMDGRLRLLHADRLPNSAGQFYAIATMACGFWPNRHEGKVTGLAAFGRHIPELQRFADSLIEVRDGRIIGNAMYGRLVIARSMAKRFGKANLAYAFQRRLETVVTQYITHHFSSRTSLRNIALGGGVFANVRLNQCVRQIKGVEQIFVYPHMADGGSCIGAAFMVDPSCGVHALRDVYLGPSYSRAHIMSALQKSGLTYTEPADLEQTVATLLHAGRLVGRFDGRMEFGPRALGNRSILSRATDPGVNQRLNQMLGRSEFMPFAPVTLMADAAKCYVGFSGAEHSSEFMTIAHDCTPWMKQCSPAVVHVDGTARPQLITVRANPKYHRLLECYKELSGFPSLINTSFNMHEEPIVCDPADAIRTYLAAGLDALAIGSFLAQRL